ncbi:MAG TPA: ankyrin repeat domain-containing protein [Sphingomicrobium sp.]
MRRFASIALVAAIAPVPAIAQYVSDAEPFLNAVRERDGDKATQLLDSRPSVVNSRNAKGETALNIVIARSDDTWMRFLLGKGADPNLPASNGDTPLITAARTGFIPAVEVLLALRAKVDSPNKMGETPLIVAVQQREIDAVKLLLAAGANPDRPDSAAGYSARDYAKRDSRNPQLLAAIEASKAKPAAAKSNDLDSFTLKPQ